MAPAIHPPCTPTASCTPQRCHPTPPPCAQPEKCLLSSRKKGLKPCQSAVSIMATKSKSRCSACSKCGGRSRGDPRSTEAVRKYLKDKKKERKLMASDRATGGHRYMDYLRKKNNPSGCCKKKKREPCCPGKGHRGVLPKRKGRCTIL